MMMRVVLAASLAATACSLFSYLAPSHVDAGTALRLDIEDLVRNADLVFEGRVLAQRSFRDTSGLVCTEYTLSVHQSYWGAPYGTRVFTLPGGVLSDGSGTVIPGMATLTVGEDALLFLAAESSNGWRPTVGLAQGKFEIVRDAHGVASLARRDTELVLVDAGSGAAAPANAALQLAYTATIERIEAAARLRAAASTTEVK